MHAVSVVFRHPLKPVEDGVHGLLSLERDQRRIDVPASSLMVRSSGHKADHLSTPRLRRLELILFGQSSFYMYDIRLHK